MYTLSTAIRKGTSKLGYLDSKSFSISKEKKTIARITGESGGMVLGMGVGLLGMLGQGKLISEIVANGHPEALIIPAATNAASLIYELGIRPLIEKKAKNLEKELDNSYMGINCNLPSK